MIEIFEMQKFAKQYEYFFRNAICLRCKIRNTIYLYIFIILTKIASDGKIIGENRWGKEN